MKKVLSLVLLTGSVLTFTGCTAIDKARGVFNPLFAIPPIVPDSEYRSLAAKYAHRADIIASVEADKLSDAEKKLKRNQVLSELLELSEHNYSKFRTGLYVHDGVFNSSLDLTSIALSTTATVVGGGTAQILSAADTAVKASQGKVSERWLASKTITVLINQMDADRAKIRADMESSMKREKYADFTMQNGFEFIQELDSASSLVSALNALETKTGETKAAAEKSLRDTKTPEQKPAAKQ
jgi:hypothetical protein